MFFALFKKITASVSIGNHRLFNGSMVLRSSQRGLAVALGMTFRLPRGYLLLGGTSVVFESQWRRLTFDAHFAVCHLPSGYVPSLRVVAVLTQQNVINGFWFCILAAIQELWGLLTLQW